MTPCTRPALSPLRPWLKLVLLWVVGVLVALPAAAQAPSTASDLADLTLSSGQKLPLPAGQWQVLASFSSQNGDVAWRNTALRNQDPAAQVPMLLVREAAGQQRWPVPACQMDNTNTFLIDWHDSRNNARLSKCSRLRTVGASLAAFRSQANELPGWSRALALVPVDSLPEDEDVLLAEATALDQQGGGVRVEALLRTEALGASSGSLYVGEQSGVLDPTFRHLTQWLTQITTTSANVLLVSPAARPQALEALLGRSPGTHPGERPAEAAVHQLALPRAVSEHQWTLPARTPAGELVYISKGSGITGATELLLKPDTDLIAPSEGNLLHTGPLDGWPSTLVIQHGARLYSVITSAQRLNLAPGIKTGTRLSPEQLLVRGEAEGRRDPATRYQLSWHLVTGSDDTVAALTSGTGDAAVAVRALLKAPQVDTQLVLGLGVLQLDLGPDVSADTLVFRVNDQSFPTADIANAALLLPAAPHTIEMTSGRLFKSSVKRQIDIKPSGTWVQSVDYWGRELGLYTARFYPNELSTTRQAWAMLETPRQPEAVATVAAATSVVPDSAMAPSSTSTSTFTPAPATPTSPPDDAAATQMQQEMALLRAQLAQLQAAPAATADVGTLPAPSRPAAPNPRRKALVIGNNAYEHVARLDNAQTDAVAIADALQTVGFQVTLGRDLSERRMKEALRNFRQTVQGGDEVVVYFAGHGVQLANTNYLLPVDIRGQSEEEVKDESIPLQRVLDDMQERRAGFMLAIIDACRDNPFRVATRSARSRGLAPTSAATGQMIIFSAGTGQQALDKLGQNDPERNGLFTRLLLREMKKPGQPIDRIVRSVRTEVARLAKTVGHEQTPAVYDQTLGDFFFIPVASSGR